MSTTDPARADAARAAARVGTPLMRFLAQATAVAVILAGAVTMWGSLAGSANSLRFAELSGGYAGIDWQAPVALIVGILTSIGFITGHVFANHAASGNPHRLTGPGPSTLWLIGAAVGAWAHLPFWLAPPTVGTKLDYDGQALPWSTAQWALHWMPLAVPVFLTIIAGIAGVLRLVRLRRADQLERLVARLRQRGVTTTGVVTQGILLNSETVFVSGQWTYRFVDAQGTTRWVRQRGMFRGRNPPTTGEVVTVLHDPAHPGDESRIFVARGDPDAPSAFTGHL